MTRYLIAYGVTLVTFLAIDAVWLSVVARNFYFERIGSLMLEKPNFLAAGAFYAFYVIGIVVFAVAPALKTGSVTTALGYGALLGLVAYGTYDMSNYATLKNWPVSVVVVDIIWGGILTGVSAAIGFYLTRLIVQQ